MWLHLSSHLLISGGPSPVYPPECTQLLALSLAALTLVLVIAQLKAVVTDHAAHVAVLYRLVRGRGGHVPPWVRRGGTCTAVLYRLVRRGDMYRLV